MRCEVPGLGETPGFNLCLQAFKYRKRISFQEQNCILRTFVRTRVRGSYSIISGVYLLLSWCQFFFLLLLFCSGSSSFFSFSSLFVSYNSLYYSPGFFLCFFYIFFFFLIYVCTISAVFEIRVSVRPKKKTKRLNLIS